MRYIDPDGRNPVYNPRGELIGVTEDTGLQGDAIIMNDKDYSPRMSRSRAERKNLGMSGLEGEEALKKFMSSFRNLKNRPDYDGKLTLDEANEWYRNGGGRELYVDINSIDLSMLYSLGDDYIYKNYTFNLQMIGSDDGLVYGNVTFKRYPHNTCRAWADKYDFDMKPGVKSIIRNGATFFGSLYAGKGIAYTINIYGVHQLELWEE